MEKIDMLRPTGCDPKSVTQKTPLKNWGVKIQINPSLRTESKLCVRKKLAYVYQNIPLNQF